MLLTPNLFADDLTILALTQMCRDRLIELTIRWTTKWRSSIKAEKSGLLTTGPSSGEPIIIMDKMFKELNHVIHLGSGIDKNGVFSEDIEI